MIDSGITDLRDLMDDASSSLSGEGRIKRVDRHWLKEDDFLMTSCCVA
jgi:hypothetical protein